MAILEAGSVDQRVVPSKLKSTSQALLVTHLFETIPD
jgi:hypothetical protein